MNNSHFTRVKSQELSLWQSSVAEYIREELSSANKSLGMKEVLSHPMSIATTEHVSKLFKDPNYVPVMPTKDDGGHEALVYKSHLAYKIGTAISNNDTELADELTRKYRKFSDKDISGFATCAVTYAKYAVLSHKHMTYNDWMIEGKNNINYGVIDWKLPDDAKVGILGDWGTGLPDAVSMLKDMMITYKPDAIIHLGDIYYSGTPGVSGECHQNFADVFTQIFDEVLGKGNRIPVFSIPGNHDYYSWGAGYYKMVAELNNFDGGTSAIQPASYFCLRTEDEGWQFLGMDTGYYDSSPSDQLNPTYAGPWLKDSEIEWLRDKVTNHKGATVLLSHHQLFSSNTTLNGKLSEMRAFKYFNPYLYKAFWDFLPTNIAAWIWGHEHNFVMYENNLNGLAKGRLVGNSAYEELTASDPYKVNFTEVPYLVPEPEYDQYKLGTNEDLNGIKYYNHGYAIIDLSQRKNPTSPVKAIYTQFPAWYDNPPKPENQISSEIYQEEFSLPIPPEGTGNKIRSQTNVLITNQDGMSIQPATNGSFGMHYPILNSSNKLGSSGAPLSVTRQSDDGHGYLQDGDTLIIQSAKLEKKLSASRLPWLSYGEGGIGQTWIIHKRDKNNNDPYLRYEEPFYLESIAYKGQFMKPNYAKKWSDIYLTTEKNMDFCWKLSLLK